MSKNLPANPPLSEVKKVTRTIDQPVSNSDLVKPGELVDVVEMTPLTLADRRIYNLLLSHAWETIDKLKTHTIAKACLRGNHSNNDRVGESIERLMAAIVRVDIEIEGKSYTRRFQLIAGTDEAKDPDGMLHYEFPVGLRALIRNSRIFARIRKDVMFALSSKYALTLYEMVQKRGNLSFQFYEDFDLERFRNLLGVEEGKLPLFRNLNQSAIKPAVLEVNALSDFGCRIEPLLEGRRVIGVRLGWWKKDENGLKDAYRELNNTKVGRRARIAGKVEEVVSFADTLPPLSEVAAKGAEWQAQNQEAEQRSVFGSKYPTTPSAHTGLIKKLRAMFPGYDIPYYEKQFQTWILTSGRTCENYEASLIGFIRKAIERFKTGK